MADALQTGRYRHLTDLLTAQQWLQWDQDHTESLSYAQAQLAMRWLVERYGMRKVAAVIQRTDSQHPFDQAFTEVLGQSPAQVDAALEATLRTQLLRPGRVLYQDDCTDPESGWATRSSPPARWQAGYEDGEYAVLQNAGCGCSPVSTGPMQLGDLEAEIDARLTPPTENTYLMLDFRVQRDGGRYRFRVDPNGQRFSLRRVARHDATDLIGWTSAAAIEPTSAANRLGIRAQGADIVLLINGTEVGRVHDDTYHESRLALGLNNARGEQAEARFANLVISSVE